MVSSDIFSKYMCPVCFDMYCNMQQFKCYREYMVDRMVQNDDDDDDDDETERERERERERDVGGGG